MLNRLWRYFARTFKSRYAALPPPPSPSRLGVLSVKKNRSGDRFYNFYTLRRSEPSVLRCKRESHNGNSSGDFFQKGDINVYSRGRITNDPIPNFPSSLGDFAVGEGRLQESRKIGWAIVAPGLSSRKPKIFDGTLWQIWNPGERQSQTLPEAAQRRERRARPEKKSRQLRRTNEGEGKLEAMMYHAASGRKSYKN